MTIVGIIGGGAAGLCALRHVLRTPGLVPVMWEKSKDIGGTWVYTEDIGVDGHGLPVHSSMYRSLRTNLPKEIMAFPGFPFKSADESYVHHTSVLAYLKQYAEHYELNKHIQMENMVQNVTPATVGSRQTGWQVTVKDLNTKQLSTIACDVIIVCNGQYSVPNMPQLPGMTRFTGLVEHSHIYRDPSGYRDKRVVVLGAAASGMDIALEIAKVASKVFLSHNFPLPIPSRLPANVQQVSGLARLKEGSHDTFVLRDGKEVAVDAVVFCTGYEYTFPFLSAECGVTIKDNQVQPLYRHMVHCNYPTMAFVGIPFQICPFPFFDTQIRYIVGSLLQIIPTPSSETMLATTSREIAKRVSLGEEQRHYHSMMYLQWEYLASLERDIVAAPWEEMAQNGGGTETGIKDDHHKQKDHSSDDLSSLVADKRYILGPHVQAIYNLTFLRRMLHLPEYKKYGYEVNNALVTDKSKASNSYSTGGFLESLDGDITKPKRDIAMLILKQAPMSIVGNLISVAKLLTKYFYYRMKKLILRY